MEQFHPKLIELKEPESYRKVSSLRRKSEWPPIGDAIKLDRHHAATEFFRG